MTDKFEPGIVLVLFRNVSLEKVKNVIESQRLLMDENPIITGNIIICRIKVDEGHETEWLKKLKKIPEVEAVILNLYFDNNT